MSTLYASPVPPNETELELIVIRMLSFAISLENLQVEARQIQIPKRGCSIQESQPDTGSFFDGLKLPAKLFDPVAAERPCRRRNGSYDPYNTKPV
jgi:hypothetical protein